MRDVIHIRAEKKKDWAHVHKVNALAFETAAEAELVDMLLELYPGYLQNASGKIEYHAAFNNK